MMTIRRAFKHMQVVGQTIQHIGTVIQNCDNETMSNMFMQWGHNARYVVVSRILHDNKPGELEDLVTGRTHYFDEITYTSQARFNYHLFETIYREFSPEFLEMYDVRALMSRPRFVTGHGGADFGGFVLIIDDIYMGFSYKGWKNTSLAAVRGQILSPHKNTPATKVPVVIAEVENDYISIFSAADRFNRRTRLELHVSISNPDSHLAIEHAVSNLKWKFLKAVKLDTCSDFSGYSPKWSDLAKFITRGMTTDVVYDS